MGMSKDHYHSGCGAFQDFREGSKGAALLARGMREDCVFLQLDPPSSCSLC
jgi:hypothetical protein